MIATLDDILHIGNLTGCDEQTIAPYYGVAQRKLKDLVGETLYNTAEADSSAYPELIFVEACFVLYYALPGLNTIFAQTGGIAIDGRIGDSGYRYMTPAEINQRRAQLLADAETTLRDSGYLTYTPEMVEKAEANEDESDA